MINSFFSLKINIQNALLLCLAIASLTLATPLLAAPGNSPSQPSQEQMQAFSNAQAKMQKLQQQLTQIQQAAVKENPDLLQQEEAFRKLLMTTFKEGGHTPEKDYQELQALQDKIQNAETPEAEREKLFKELQQKNAEFQKMQREVMQDKDITKAQDELNTNILNAMKKQNPDTEKLLSELQETQQKLVQIRQAAMGGSH